MSIMNKNKILFFAFLMNVLILGCGGISEKDIAKSLIKESSFDGWRFRDDEPITIRIVEKRDTFIDIMLSPIRVVGEGVNNTSGWKSKKILAEVTTVGKHGFIKMFYMEKELYRNLIDLAYDNPIHKNNVLSQKLRFDELYKDSYVLVDASGVE
jgi:hypothetical protein